MNCGLQNGLPENFDIVISVHYDTKTRVTPTHAQFYNTQPGILQPQGALEIIAVPSSDFI